jgi:hypothetical protein
MPAPSFAKAGDDASSWQLYLTIAVVPLGLASYLGSFGPMFIVSVEAGPVAELPGGVGLGIAAALLAALLAATSLLPKVKSYPAIVAAISVLGSLKVTKDVLSLPDGVSIGWALWLVLACAGLEAIVAIGALLLGVGVITAPQPRPKYPKYEQYGQYRPYGAQQGGYYGQQHTPYQQQPASGYGSQYGGYPAAPSSGPGTGPSTGGFTAAGPQSGPQQQASQSGQHQSGQQQGSQQGPPTPPTGFPTFGQPPSAGSGTGSPGSGQNQAKSGSHGDPGQGQQSYGQGQQQPQSPSSGSSQS